MKKNSFKTLDKPCGVFIIQNDSHKEPIHEEERLMLQWKDILAIVIAIYKIFIPWAIAIAGVYALLLLTFDLIY